MEAFTFGYWGWGNHTQELVKTVNRIERDRGHRAPIWVDIRIRRNVRAQGFQGDAFAATAGKSNYRWCQGLGNQAILDGGRMRLMQPEAVGELLSLIQEADSKNRRIIAFCACQFPESVANPCVTARWSPDCWSRKQKPSESGCPSPNGPAESRSK